MKTIEAIRYFEFFLRSIGRTGYKDKIASTVAACELAVAALKERENNRWIPVSERLPKGFGTFLVTIDEVHGENRRSVDAADFDPFAKTWTTSNYFCAGYKVTHWKSLPEPWKGDEA